MKNASNLISAEQPAFCFYPHLRQVETVRHTEANPKHEIVKKLVRTGVQTLTICLV